MLRVALMTKQKLLMKMMTKVQDGKVLGMLFSAQMLESTKVIISCTSMATLGKWQNMKLEMITRKMTANLSSAFRLFSLALSTILGELSGFFCLKKQWYSGLEDRKSANLKVVCWKSCWMKNDCLNNPTSREFLQAVPILG